MSAADPRNVRDMLLEAGYSAEDVDVMLSSNALLDALCLMCLHYGRDLDIDEREGFRFINGVLMVAHGEGVFGSQRRGDAIDRALRLLP